MNAVTVSLVAVALIVTMAALIGLALAYRALSD